MRLTQKHISELLGGELEGDPDKEITHISTLEKAKEGHISFLANPKYEKHLYQTEASAVLVQKNFQPKSKVSASLIRVDYPYLAFTTLLEEYQRIHAVVKEGKESPCYIDQSASIGKSSYIGAFAYIGEHVKIGNHVKIYPHCYIGDHVSIDSHTILYPGVKVYPDSQIGKYCTIQSGAVIGSHGFGFAPQPDGSYKSIPQIGNVILEDHVDIGANTTIDCGTVSSTIIHKGVKIDNLVQVAHNVEIGENSVLAAQTGISGSTIIGKSVTMGGQVGVEGHITVADHTKVAAKSGVTKPVKKEHQVIGGKFAYHNPDYLKSYAVFKKLPEVTDRLEKLEQKLLNLNDQLRSE